MNEYCTLEQLRDYLTAASVDMSRADDDRLMRYANQASRLIDKYCRQRRFYPRVETRRYNWQHSYSLLLDEDLLEASSLTSGGTEVSSSVYWPYPLNTYPKWQIQIDKSQSEIFDFNGTLQRQVSVVGTWGWHDDWDNAWPDSQDEVEDASLAAADTTITVNDADGADADGFAPRFAPGQLLKIESEYVAVTGVDWSANTLTVRRGVNGTTAASHAQNTDIYVYRPPEIATAAALALAKFIYETRSATGGIIALPSLEGAALRASVQQVLDNFELPVKPDNMMRFV